MKRLIVFVFVAMFLSGCVENIRSDRELYGNTFINIGGEEFEVPDDWVLYNLMDSACSIMMPTYMTETFLDGVDIIDKNVGTTFTYRSTIDTVNHSYKHHYSRVAIDYIKAKSGTFAKPNQFVLNAEMYASLEKMVDNEIHDRNLILNGPFMQCATVNMNGRFTSTYFLDTYYRRKSVIGEGPVSVHIFIMQNDDKMVKMMVSYHDEDSLVFKDLFQSVKTFMWN